MKKILCLFLCIAIFTGTLSACGDNESPQPQEETTATEETTAPAKESKGIILGYYEDKSFNPFKTGSPTNKNLMTLVYDGLFLPTEGYGAEPLIADSFTNSEKMLTVTLNSGAMFSDGSYITPADVVYSFDKAKESQHYKARLQGFSSAAAGVDSVTFMLSAKNIYAENCLTFPIVKYGTADKAIPVGSGRYALKKNKSGYILKANENSVRQEQMATKTISLVPITSDTGELYLLQTGDLTYFFDDLSDGEYTKIGANTATVSLNNMVYLGLNHNTSELKNKNVKKAIHYAMDKQTLCDMAYSSVGNKTDIPFNPDWWALEEYEGEELIHSPSKAEELLEKAGYVYAYSHNKYRSKNFKYIELTMIVNSENQPRVTCAKEIARSLREVGIDVRLSILEYDEYISALARGDFDLYLGEVKLTPDMSLSAFFSENASVGYGIDKTSPAAKAYYDFIGGKTDISTFCQVFRIENPFIPLFFRQGIAYYSRELSYEDTCNEYEPFLNIYSWSVTN